MAVYQVLTDRDIASSTAITPTTLIHIVTTGDTSQGNPAGSSYKAELQQLSSIFSGGTFSGGSGNCITDLYVSNIHSCLPLNINPLDEGNVYFGSTSGVTIDVINGRVGIGTSNPQYKLDVVNTNSRLFYESAFGGSLSISGATNLPRLGTFIPPYLTKLGAGGSVGMRSWDDATFPAYGEVGDMFIYSDIRSNGLNLISAPGTGTDDYIRFYAGINATSTPDLHIQGSGATRGYVGIGTLSPSEKLDVNGKTKTTTLQVTSGATNGYVLTSDGSGNAIWQVPTDVRVTGGTYDNGTGIATFTNNTGSTFNVTGFTTGFTETQNLTNVLVLGNTTGANDIVVEDGQKIESVSGNTSIGFVSDTELNIVSTGDVYISGGTSVEIEYYGSPNITSYLLLNNTETTLHMDDNGVDISTLTLTPTNILSTITDNGYGYFSSKEIKPQQHQSQFSRQPNIFTIEDKRAEWTQTADDTTTLLIYCDVDPNVIVSGSSIVQIKAHVRGISSDKTTGYAAEITSWVRLVQSGGTPITQIGVVDYTIKSEFTTASSSFVISGPNMYIDVTGEIGITIDWTCNVELLYDKNTF